MELLVILAAVLLVTNLIWAFQSRGTGYNGARSGRSVYLVINLIGSVLLALSVFTNWL